MLCIYVSMCVYVSISLIKHVYKESNYERRHMHISML